MSRPGCGRSRPIIARDASANTITVQTGLIGNIVLGIPKLALHAEQAGSGNQEHAALAWSQLEPIVAEAIDRLSETGISSEQIAALEIGTDSDC